MVSVVMDHEQIQSSKVHTRSSSMDEDCKQESHKTDMPVKQCVSKCLKHCTDKSEVSKNCADKKCSMKSDTDKTDLSKSVTDTFYHRKPSADNMDLRKSGTEKMDLRKSGNETMNLRKSGNEKMDPRKSGNEKLDLRKSGNEKMDLRKSSNEKVDLRKSGNERMDLRKSGNVKMDHRKGCTDEITVRITTTNVVKADSSCRPEATQLNKSKKCSSSSHHYSHKSQNVSDSHKPANSGRVDVDKDRADQDSPCVKSESLGARTTRLRSVVAEICGSRDIKSPAFRDTEYSGHRRRGRNRQISESPLTSASHSPTSYTSDKNSSQQPAEIIKKPSKLSERQTNGPARGQAVVRQGSVSDLPMIPLVQKMFAVKHLHRSPDPRKKYSGTKNMSISSMNLAEGTTKTTVDCNGKFGTSSLATEPSDLEDGEIIDSDVSDHIHSQGKRKRKYGSSKTETVAANMSKKFVDRAEIVDLHKVAARSSKHARRSTSNQLFKHCKPVDAGSWWVDSSLTDTPGEYEQKDRSNLKTRSTKVKYQQLEVDVTEVPAELQNPVAAKGETVEQINRCTSAALLEDGEVPSDSDVNSILALSGSDMSISSEDSNVVVLECDNIHVRASMSDGLDTSQVCSSSTTQISTSQPQVSILNPSAPSFIPKSSSPSVEDYQLEPAGSLHTSAMSRTSTHPQLEQQAGSLHTSAMSRTSTHPQLEQQAGSLHTSAMSRTSTHPQLEQQAGSLQTSAMSRTSTHPQLEQQAGSLHTSAMSRTSTHPQLEQQAGSLHTSAMSRTSTHPQTQMFHAQDGQAWTVSQPPNTSRFVSGYSTQTVPSSQLQTTCEIYNPFRSMVSSMRTPQNQSKPLEHPYLQQSLLCLPGSKLWTASSVQQMGSLVKPTSAMGFSDNQMFREYSSQTSGRKIHLNLCVEQTCPELTDTSRCWHSVREADAAAGSLEFTVMSYNILSQELMFRHMDLYSRCQQADLEWTNRGTALLTQIIAHNADIVCLQEVQEDHWRQDIKVSLAERGYHGVYKRLEGEKPDGCAILFKNSKFLQLKCVPVEFLKGGILDRSNVGLIILLQPRKEVYRGNTQKICVATTHLLFNPRRGDIKLAQLIVFLAEIDKHAYLENGSTDRTSWISTRGYDNSLGQEKHSQTFTACESSTEGDKPESSCEPPKSLMQSQLRHDYCPIILCGDFNSEPYSDLYKFITTGHLKYDDLIARFVCGQEEGRFSGSDRTVGRRLLPAHLSISETCQYIQVLKERYKRNNGSITKEFPKVNSGQIFHSMNFQSVYTHFVDAPGPRKKEISTHHNKSSCTVDYIFYSTSGVRRQQKAHIEQAPSPSDCCKTSQFLDSHISDHTDSTHVDNVGMSRDNVGMSRDNVGVSRDNVGMPRDNVGVSRDNVGVSRDNVDMSRDNVGVSRDNVGVSRDNVDMSRDNVGMSRDNVDMPREPLELLARYRLLTAKEVAQFGFMPNSTLPSDHLCLIARFLLR